MKYINIITIFLFVFIFSGCAQKSLTNIFIEKSEKEGVNYKTLMAICYVESGHKEYVVNVNESILDIQRGGHYFDTWIGANLYMDLVLDPLLLNYDIGICQINKQHLKRMELDNEDLLDKEKNIEIAAKIYNYNVRACKGEIECALSMYNTGKKNSYIGKKYANKVLKTKQKLFKD